MLDEQEIQERLHAAGVDEKEIASVMRDVSQLIVRKATAAYIETLPKEFRERIGSLSEQDTVEFVEKNKGSFPKYPQTEFDRIYDGTWNDYFKFVAQI